ncbi:RNHCP domain-containing protein [Dermabacteraceae bacterium P7074]
MHCAQSTPCALLITAFLPGTTAASTRRVHNLPVDSPAARERKSPVTRKVENCSFACQVCGSQIRPIARGTIRDHCTKCLHSLHVDVMPGDRASDCGGVLVPTGTDYKAKKGIIIIYRCKECGETRRNRAATDDDLSAIMELQAPR